jgi:hypothetical protein
MDSKEAEARMDEVRRIMERATLYTLLPGASAVVGGVLALLGCGATYAMTRSLDFQNVLYLPLKYQYGFCIMWTAIGMAAVVQHAWLTGRAARRSGIPAGSRPARLATYALTPSVFVAVVLTLKLLMDLQMRYIAPVWMMCYGSGVYTAGLFSVRLPRVLGLLFIGSGAVGLLFCAEYGLVLAALSFGVFHLVFGLVVIRRAAGGEET